MGCRFMCVVFWSAIVLLLVNVYLLLSLGAEHSSFISWEARNAAHLRETVSTRSVETDEPPPKKLAVIVPTHSGDFADTIKSLEKWPATCSLDTLTHVDLVIYKAEDFDPKIEEKVRFLYAKESCFLVPRETRGERSKSGGLPILNLPSQRRCSNNLLVAPWIEQVLPRFRNTAGRCFADTRMVYANLTKEVRGGLLRSETFFFQSCACCICICTSYVD